MANKYYLYRHFDKEGILLYIGVSLNSIKRLSQHQNNAHWFPFIRQIKIESFDTREAALEAERIAITIENPLHNLLRPSVKEQRENNNEISSKDLIRRIVQFNPTYRICDVAGSIGTTEKQVKEWIGKGIIGWISVGNRSYKGQDRPVIRITGWQLIEFIEYLESKKGDTP